MEKERGRRDRKNRTYQVSQDPFARTLESLAVEKGFKTQSALAKAIGSQQNTVRTWYSDRSIPAPAYIEALITVLKPDQLQIDELTDKWGVHLETGRGFIGIQKDTETGFKSGRSHLLNQNRDYSPLSNWIIQFTGNRHLTLRRFSQRLGIQERTFNMNVHNRFSSPMMARILEKTPAEYGFNEDEERELADAVCEDIQLQLAQGRQFRSYNPSEGTTVQKELSCTTYTGGQAGKALGVSREAIRLQRKTLSINHTLLTEDELNLIRKNLAESPKKAYSRGNKQTI